MNIRQPGDTSFPARDVVPSSIFTEKLQCSQAEYTARCCAFFAAVFKTLEKDLSELIPSPLRSGRSNIPAVIEAWNDRMCDVRSAGRIKFFKTVEIQYLAVCTSDSDESISIEADVAGSLQTLSKIDVMKESKGMKGDEDTAGVEEVTAKVRDISLASEFLFCWVRSYGLRPEQVLLRLGLHNWKANHSLLPLMPACWLSCRKFLSLVTIHNSSLELTKPTL
jgi:hypothetical protein